MTFYFFFKKSKKTLLPAIPFLGIYPKEINATRYLNRIFVPRSVACNSNQSINK